MLGFSGFACMYLQKCWNKTKLINEADIEIYTILLKLDSRFELTDSQQLETCVQLSPRIDLIQVNNNLKSDGLSTMKITSL